MFVRAVTRVSHCSGCEIYRLLMGWVIGMFLYYELWVCLGYRMGVSWGKGVGYGCVRGMGVSWGMCMGYGCVRGMGVSLGKWMFML